MVLSRAAVLLLAKRLSWLLLSSSSCTRASVWPGAESAAPRSICVQDDRLFGRLAAEQGLSRSLGA